MHAMIEITPWHYVLFVSSILFCLALDLGVFHRRAHVVSFKEALGWTAVWMALAGVFCATLVPLRGRQEALEFVTGYVIELSLSMDNVFVIAVIFSYFGVAHQYQHRVLFWGILGALVMRGLMIGGGVALVARFHWTLYVFGAFLLVSGLKMVVQKDETIQPERNPVLKLARKLFPISPGYDGQKFLTRWNGRRALTPLALVLLMVETTDLLFALDSIPAIFAITNKFFIIFTSNVFAILGLRSLYFLLAGAIRYFRYLKAGLSLVLVFIGAKMLLAAWIMIPTWIALIVVGAILAAAIAVSVVCGTHRQPPESRNPQ